jgi:hypothetical protein
MGEAYLGKLGWCGVDYIDLARDSDEWRALVVTVMNFGLA